jgi:hypothetical protein
MELLSRTHQTFVEMAAQPPVRDALDELPDSYWWDAFEIRDTEIELVRPKNWTWDRLAVNNLLSKGYKIDRIVSGSEGWLITLRR